MEASSALERSDGQVVDPHSSSRAKTGPGEWNPPEVHADSTAIFNGVLEAASGVQIVHSSDVSELRIEGGTDLLVGAAVFTGFPGRAVATARETFSVAFSLTEATPVLLSNDATIRSAVNDPRPSGLAVLSRAAGGEVLSLSLFADGSKQALLEPGSYVFTASSEVTTSTFPILRANQGFDGGYSFSLVAVPEAEHIGLAAAALLGFGLWRRRAGR